MQKILTMDANKYLPILSLEEINEIDEFRKAKQTAVLAILFSDIENSTYASEKLGEQNYSKLRHIHEELFVRIMTRDNSGKIIKEMGDSFLCVFSEPTTAVLRAIEFQNAIYSNRENLTIGDFTIKVKIGIHIGQVALENNFALDIFGRHVNRASRIQSIARGGQILSSQSIWENAVGWINTHDQNNIKWVSYGKVKLKGIQERIEIYSFYSTETGKPSTPSIIKRERQKNQALLIVLIVFILVVAYVAFEKINQLQQDAITGTQLNPKKLYYVQFDFSKLKNLSNADQKIIGDTNLIQENMLSQLIAVFNPDSILTEVDLSKRFSKAGKFYVRRQNKSSSDSNYFRDSLSFSGALFITATNRSYTKDDSLEFHIRMDMYPNHENSSAAERKEWFSISYIESPFRNLIQDMILSTSSKAWIIQGYVINSNDSFLYFHIAKEANLRVGASIKLMREYNEMEGLQKRLTELNEKITYFTNINDSVLIKRYTQEFKKIEADILKSHSRGRWSTGIDMRGKVVELYDSTGKATWALKSKFPNDKPKEGDLIYLAY